MGTQAVGLHFQNGSLCTVDRIARDLSAALVNAASRNSRASGNSSKMWQQQMHFSYMTTPETCSGLFSVSFSLFVFSGGVNDVNAVHR